ncbi:hypothetical protein KAFR_0D02050 [Kazachstania africana CBS 2517]|uniref:Uncharacterized protein n=1 Tax=Kazachstania africana (strain ATCC 22294 / BCRC 22015 / CBS 2517 / CECT 1963 / NBRC 1671 / NRRL Y-8276) TaxID=1071382 RepID=H2AU02_KAZAF|nr:hypothetical protein KAFR_0D02050 [Kazachstania africana CBS 2517]CCF57852.1 hypothetical protein KAFR_0D02050 [Kazachstania africana CBS 2517]
MKTSTISATLLPAIIGEAIAEDSSSSTSSRSIDVAALHSSIFSSMSVAAAEASIIISLYSAHSTDASVRSRYSAYLSSSSSNAAYLSSYYAQHSERASSYLSEHSTDTFMQSANTKLSSMVSQATASSSSSGSSSNGVAENLACSGLFIGVAAGAIGLLL